ncbi:MAG: hypothetical protein WAM26_06250 [Nitrososphaeraceae archaeon]
MALRRGIRIAFPAGIEHVSSSRPPSWSARNHTGPPWLAAHFSGVKS